MHIQFTTNETLRANLPLTESYIGRIFTRDSASDSAWYNWKVLSESHYLIAQKKADYTTMVNNAIITFNPTVTRRHAEANSIQILNETSILFERLKAYEGEFNFDLFQSTGVASSCTLSFQMSTDNINWTETQMIDVSLTANNRLKETTPLFLITSESTNGLNECRYGRVVIHNLVGEIQYKVRFKSVEI